MRFTKPTAILAVAAALFITLPTRCSCSGSSPPPTDARDATPEPPTGVTSYAVTWTCQRDCDLAFPFSTAETLRLELEDAGGFFAFFVGGEFRFGGQVVEESALCFDLRWSGQQVPESRLCATGPGSVLGSVVWLDTIVQRTTEWTFAGIKVVVPSVVGHQSSPVRGGGGVAAAHVTAAIASGSRHSP